MVKITVSIETVIFTVVEGMKSNSLMAFLVCFLLNYEFLSIKGE